jgi:hypothetical protein
VGLRPPLLCWCAEVCQRKNDFCDARTHTTRSGGRQPAVGQSHPHKPCLVPGRLPIVYERGYDRVIVTTGADAHRSWLARRAFGEQKRYLRCTNDNSQERRASHRRALGRRAYNTSATFGGGRTITRAAGVSPPWFLTPVQSREFTTVGLRPPLLVGVRTSAGDKTIFAMHERTLLGARAAGVSPPWVSNPGAVADVYHGGLTPTAPGWRADVRRAKRHLRCTNDNSQERRASARRGFLTLVQSRRFTTVGLRPPLLVGERTFGEQNDICDAQTTTHKSGDRQPAVGF